MRASWPPATGISCSFTKVLEAIQVGELTFAELEALPSGLAGLYLEFFDRIYRRGNVDFAPARTVLQAITAAQEPPTQNDLAALTGLDAEQEIPAILRRLASFVSQSEQSYRLVHKSLFDWLTGWDRPDRSTDRW